METIQESDREHLLRCLRTFLSGLSMALGCVFVYLFGYGIAHKNFQPITFIIFVPSFVLTWWLARRHPGSIFLGLSFASLNAAYLALALSIVLHPCWIEKLSSLPAFQQGLVATTLFCIPFSMLSILLDVTWRIRQENNSGGAT